MSGAARVVGYGAMPLGGLVGGKAAEIWGIPAVLVGIVVVGVISTVLVVTLVPQRLMDAHELDADQEKSAPVVLDTEI